MVVFRRHVVDSSLHKLRSTAQTGIVNVACALYLLRWCCCGVACLSRSRRIDKLEESTAPPEREKQDKAVKELARSARCLSQALPGE